VSNGVTASSRVTGNFLGTGYDATAVLYDYGTHVKVLVWPNTPGSHFSTGWAPWWDSATAAPVPVHSPFEFKKAKVVAGYFTGSQYSDIAILYDASDASCPNHAIWYVLKSTGTSFQTYMWWDSQQKLGSSIGCQFAVSRSKPIVGEFEGDGRSTDVAILYDLSTGGCASSVRWYVFLSTTVGSFELDTPSGDSDLSRPWYASGCNAFDWSKSKPIAGYFGSTVAQVAVFYDYSATCAPGQPRSTVDIFSTTGTYFPAYAIRWDSGSACNRFPWSRSVPIAGNFTGHPDNQTDIAVLFDSSYACIPIQPDTQLYLLISNGTLLQTSTQPPWDSGCNQFAWNWSKVEAGYFTGGGVADLAVFYYYTWHCPPQQTDSGWLVFVPSGTQFTGYSRWDTYPYPPTCDGVDWNLSSPA
jgi:hypothetical protein